MGIDALSRLTDFERETMENMFESQFLRSQQVPSVSEFLQNFISSSQSRRAIHALPRYLQYSEPPPSPPCTPADAPASSSTRRGGGGGGGGEGGGCVLASSSPSTQCSHGMACVSSLSWRLHVHTGLIRDSINSYLYQSSYLG